MAFVAGKAWTDERLDDLNRRVDRGFNEMRTEFRAIRQEMGSELGGVRGELGGVRGELGGVRGEIAALNRTIHQFMFAIVGAILVGFCGTIAALVSLV